MAFLKEEKDYEEYEKQTLEHKLLQFTSKVSKTYLNYEFYDYVVFKFNDDAEEEILKWMDRGAVKSKYLLQFMDEDTLEEHSFLITTPEIFKVSRDMISNKMEDLNITIVSDSDVNVNNISVLRLCLGVNLDNIFSTQKIERRGKNA